MDQDWTRDYFENEIQNCKLHFGYMFIHWLNDLKHLVPEVEKDPIEDEFHLIWEWLNSLIYTSSTARANIHNFFRKMQILMDYISIVKFDRRRG